MALESFLEKVQKSGSPACPNCGNHNMKYIGHLFMYGGYVCSKCNKVWSANDPQIKKKLA